MGPVRPRRDCHVALADISPGRKPPSRPCWLRGRDNRIQPDGLAVVMEADHFCMRWRGVKDTQPVMTNSVMRGAFLENPDLHREFLSLRKHGHD